MILGDRDLRTYIETGRLKIKPLDPEIIRENGLDLRLAPEIARLKNTGEPVDTVVSGQDPTRYYDIEHAQTFILYPNEHALLSTIEYIELPDDLMAFVNLRSTYARLGILAPPTIADAGFKGTITIEVMGGAFPIKLHAGQRFIHLIFAKVNSPVQKPYRGKYQGQKGIKLPKIFKQPLSDSIV